MNRVPLRIARTEYRRTSRSLTESYTRVAIYALMVLLFFVPLLLVAVYVLPSAGEAVAEGSVSDTDFFTVSELATGAAAAVWLFVAIMATMRVTTTVADVDEPAFLLVSTSVRNAVVGLLGAELLRFATWLVPPLFVISAAFSYGYGSVLPMVLVFLVFAIVLTTALAVAFVVGVWIRHLLTVYEPVAKFRTPIFVLLGALYFGSIAMGWFDTISATAIRLLTDTPLGWPGHLLLFATPSIEPSILAIGGTVLGVALVVPLALAAGVRSATLHWFADPARTDDEEVATVESSNRLEGLLAGALGRPTRTVTVTVIRRTIRSPIRLLYVGYPLFGAIFFVEDFVRTGTVTSFVAVVLCLYVVWGAGALFTLNPMGDLGRALPAVLTSTLSGRQAVSGLVIAGALVAVPVAAVVSIAAGLISPLSVEWTAALAAGAVVGAAASPALATGVGTAFPRFGSVRVTGKREAVMPSKAAFVVYSLGIAAPTVAAVALFSPVDPATVAAAIRGLIAQIASVDVPLSGATVTGAAWVVLVGGLVSPVVSYLYAVRGFDGYALD